MILFYVMYLLVSSLYYNICCHCFYFAHYCFYFMLLQNEDETVLVVNHVVTKVTSIFLKLSLVITVILLDVSDHFTPTP